MSKRKYANIGDKVQIVRPYLFVRCGYPLDSNAILLDDEKRKEIDRIIDGCAKVMGSVSGRTIYSDVHRRLESAAVSYLLNKAKFGGTERKVYEEEEKRVKDMIGTVMSRKIVYEGKYVGGYVSGYEEPEWNPAYLSCPKAHCIYDVDLPRFYQVRIDAGNCRAIVGEN